MPADDARYAVHETPTRMTARYVEREARAVATFYLLMSGAAVYRVRDRLLLLHNQLLLLDLRKARVLGRPRGQRC